MSPRGNVDFTLQDSVEQLLTQSCCEDGHCMDAVVEQELRNLPGNDVCIDCGRPDPEWASVNLGIFMCLDCSGQHRALGTHISFVRSVKMDSWSGSQLKMMFLGGNQQCTDFLIQYGMKNLTANSKPFRRMTIKERYDCAQTLLYQQILQARRDGRPEPKKLPNYTPSPATPVKPVTPETEKPVKMTGFGNSSPSDAQKPRLTIESAFTMFRKMTQGSKQ